MQVLIVLAGIIALIAGVIVVYYAVSLVVLRGVSLLFPLTGRRRRK